MVPNVSLGGSFNPPTYMKGRVSVSHKDTRWVGKHCFEGSLRRFGTRFGMRPHSCCFSNHPGIDHRRWVVCRAWIRKHANLEPTIKWRMRQQVSAICERVEPDTFTLLKFGFGRMLVLRHTAHTRIRTSILMASLVACSVVEVHKTANRDCPRRNTNELICLNHPQPWGWFRAPLHQLIDNIFY